MNKFCILNGSKNLYSQVLQNYLVFIPAKNYIKYFHGTTQIYLRKSNGMSEKNIENITKADSNFASTFADHHVLPDINFNQHRFINNNISIPQKSIYFLHTKSMVKKCKHRFYIKEFLIWICKAN